MTQVLQYTFRLFGPRKGMTTVINGHQFVNGVFKMIGRPENVSHAMRVLGYYGAYALGTEEYDNALKREQSDGSSEVQGSSEPGSSDSNGSGLQSNGGEPSEVSSDVVSGNTDASGGSTGVRAKGDGHSDTWVPDFSEAGSIKPASEPAGEPNTAVATAVMKLDPENDEHWTALGLPRLTAVEEALGRAGVTRSDVESAVPGWNRDKALEKAVSDL